MGLRGSGKVEACPGGPRTGFAWAWLFGSNTGEIENGVRPRPGEDPSLVGQPWYDPGGQGDWTLLWTDAPDITGLGSSLPFAPTLGRIGQEISAADGTVVNVIEWRPASLLTTLRSELSEDSVEQRVVTGFTEATPGDVKLVLKGAGLRPRRVLNRDLELGPYDTTGLFSLPFGEFKVLYNDGSLRVVKTGQNFYSVNERYYGK